MPKVKDGSLKQKRQPFGKRGKGGSEKKGSLGLFFRIGKEKKAQETGENHKKSEGGGC